jgi:hypothetical protein
MLKIVRWGRHTAWEWRLCEGPELMLYTTTGEEYHGLGCPTNDPKIWCETDNGLTWDLCENCAGQLGYKDANGR